MLLWTISIYLGTRHTCKIPTESCEFDSVWLKCFRRCLQRSSAGRTESMVNTARGAPVSRQGWIGVVAFGAGTAAARRDAYPMCDQKHSYSTAVQMGTSSGTCQVSREREGNTTAKEKNSLIACPVSTNDIIQLRCTLIPSLHLSGMVWHHIIILTKKLGGSGWHLYCPRIWDLAVLLGFKFNQFSGFCYVKQIE